MILPRLRFYGPVLAVEQAPIAMALQACGGFDSPQIRQQCRENLERNFDRAIRDALQRFFTSDPVDPGEDGGGA